MRILFVVTKGTLGGAQRYVLDLAAAARQKGMDVAVAHGTPGWLEAELDARNIRRVVLPHLGRDVRMRADLRALRELWSVIRKERPDVLHLNSSKAAAFGALIGRLLRIPRVIVTVHGWAFNEPRPLPERAAIYGIQWFTTLLSHASIVISHADAREARRFWWCAGKIALIHNGIDDFERLPKYDARAWFRKHAPGMSPGGVWVGIIAELTRNKGVDILIGAFEGLAARHPEAQLLVVGGGELWGTLTARSRALRARERIHLVNLGGRTEARRLIGAFDIFVLPSRKEGLPYVLLEAGRAALPSIATRVGGNPDIIEHGVSGLLIPPEDPAALSSELESLMSDIPRRVAFGRALEKRVETLFTAARMAEETFAVYRES